MLNNPETSESSLKKPRRYLVMRHQGSMEQNVEITKDPFTLGRSPECDLVLDHPRVSRKHAVFSQSGATTKIQDLDTGNGTFVNGKRVAQEILAPNDEIAIGPFQIFFRIDMIPRDPASEEDTVKQYAQAAAPEPTPEPTPEQAAELVLESLESAGDSEESPDPIEPGYFSETASSAVPEEGISLPKIPAPSEEEFAESLETSPLEVASEFAPHTEAIPFEPSPRNEEDGSSEEMVFTLEAPLPEVNNEPLALEIQLDLSTLPEAVAHALRMYITPGVTLPLQITLKSKTPKD